MKWNNRKNIMTDIDTKRRIRKLASEKNAVILAHNYTLPEIQDIADMCGDSLELSIRAADTDADIIVFCGVHFMAETAAILSPQKTVLIPRQDATCPMAEMASPDDLEKVLESRPLPVVSYVNTTAAVKALSTICCTSANVVRVVNSMPEDELQMVPDRNLSAYAAGQTEKKLHAWPGFCPVHEGLTPEMVKKAKEAHPNAVFMAHPECRPEVLDMADKVASTSGMIKYARSAENDQFIVGTETGLLYPLSRACPEKRFFPAADTLVCGDMKKTRLADVLSCLETLSGEVRVPEDVRLKALSAVKRMVDLG